VRATAKHGNRENDEQWFDRLHASLPKKMASTDSMEATLTLYGTFVNTSAPS